MARLFECNYIRKIVYSRVSCLASTGFAAFEKGLHLASTFHQLAMARVSNLHGVLIRNSLNAFLSENKKYRSDGSIV